MLRVELVRHGPSAHLPVSGAFAREEVEAWYAAYTSAGILTEAQPPADLMASAASATHLVCSDLERAVVSAKVLSPARAPQVSELFREVMLPIPRWPGRLPLRGWAALIYAGWSFRVMRGTDATQEDLRRVAAAADWLETALVDGTSAVVVTHGVFRRLLGRELVARGWQSETRRGGWANWSSWGFTRGI
jgi:broad specificity phosphatase PhoE